MKKFSIIIVLALCSIIAFTQDAKDFYKEAKKISKDGNHFKSVEYCTKAIDADKEYSNAYLLRAESYLELNKNEEASKDLIIASKSFEKKKDVQYLTANTLYSLKKYNQAIPYALNTIEIDDEYIDGLQLAYQIHYYAEKYDKAKEINEKAINQDKENATHYYYQGIIAFAQENMTLAEEGLVACAKLDKDFENVYTELTDVRIAKGLFKKAAVTADVAISKNPKDENAYKLKAFAQTKATLFDDAISTLTTMMDIIPTSNVEGHFLRGNVYLENQNTEKAKQDFTFSIKQNPEYIEALEARAKIYEKQNEKVLAVNDLNKIISINSTNEAHKKIIENSKYKIYELNKESNAPKIQVISHKVDDKNFIEFKANQTIHELKLQVTDESKIKTVSVNGKGVAFDENAINPLVKYEFNGAEVEHLRIEVEDAYLNKHAETYHVKLKKIDPPKISLTEPYASTNGETYVDKDVKDLFVEGKINHTEKIKSILVNGIPASYLHDKLNPSFSAKIQIENLTSFKIEVEGEFGTKSNKTFNLIRTDVSADNPMGKTWVVFIENSNYENFSSLEGPTKDINLIKSSLAGYSITKIIHKKDMSKEDLAKFFSIELRDMIKKDRVNSLMVWYAGHGKFVNETGYWIPTDAKRDEEYSYYNINTLRASMQSYDQILVHNLVITDACESGPSFYLAMRDAPEERVCGDWEATKFRSAQVLSSAGYELAVDNSQFTKTFASMLQHNPDNCIPIEKISNKVVEAVAQSGNQKPSLGKIKGLSDQNGTFFFIKK